MNDVFESILKSYNGQDHNIPIIQNNENENEQDKIKDQESNESEVSLEKKDDLNDLLDLLGDSINEYKEKPKKKTDIIDFLEIPNYNNDTFLYSLTIAFLPNFYQKPYEVIKKNLDEIKKKMAYDLDEMHYYEDNHYKKIFKKTDLQQKLLDGVPICNRAFRLYFSDYFNVNIIILYKNIQIKEKILNQRPNIILKYQNNKFHLGIQTNGLGIHSKKLIDKFTTKYTSDMDFIQPKSKYLINDLQKIANGLGIPIEEIKEGKMKKKKKDALYEEIYSMVKDITN